MSKKYGLIKPTANQQTRLKPACFNSDNDSSDESSNPTKPNIHLGDTQKRQARLLQENALKDDPTIYQYDELYDDIKEKRATELKAKKQEDKRSAKYIDKLLVAADKRKKDYERRIERQVQKERETEGDMFKDKEIFVTSTYRKKLEEMKEADELEKRMDYLESVGEVTKQRDLGGFYRHLYEQKMGNPTIPEVVIVPQESRNEEVGIALESIDNLPVRTKPQDRKYRKRRLSNENNDEDLTGEQKRCHLQSNLDADSDFSIDSESDSDNESMKNDEKTVENSETILNVSIEVKTPDKEDKSIDDKPVMPPSPPPQSPKPKIDIWKKRTVGAILDAALQRYYERKILRT